MTKPNEVVDVLIITTGGTFDKEYNELTGELIFNKTHVKEMLAKGRCLVKVKILELMMIDSMEMNERHYEEIKNACINNNFKSIVITHGTDKMVETAKYLGKANIIKTIVLTGAMIPYAFESSDGLFNLGTAISLAQIKSEGVYISMNGKSFDWQTVIKDRNRGVFVNKLRRDII